MTRTCLVSLYGNGNVLAAIAAVHWYNLQKHPKDDIKVMTIVNTPGISNEIMQESGRITTKIITSQGWPEPIFLNHKDLSKFIPSLRNMITFRKGVRSFRQKLGIEQIDEIFYAHDVHGQVPGLVMNAYPEAERIVFGDGLGSIYNKIYHLTLKSGASREKARQAVRRGDNHQTGGLKRILINLITESLLGKPKPYQADQAVLILPMDQTGTSLDNVELIVVPRQYVQNIITQCQKSLTDLEEYMRKLLTSNPPPYAIILLENIADANLSKLEDEVTLYEESIKKNVLPGSTIFIKGHPLSIAPVDKMLCDRLGDDYSPRIISHEYARYPIELWKELLSACKVISIAYSSVTLAYLYDIPVVYALNDASIEKYIHPKYWEFFRDADLLYRGQLENLKTWNGQSILWKGSVQ
jgi:hypothetical protein